MDRQTRYPKEVRERAVRLVFEHEREYNSQCRLVATSTAARASVRLKAMSKGLRWLPAADSAAVPCT